MSHTIVTYTVKPGREQENAARLREFLKDGAHEGIRAIRSKRVTTVRGAELCSTRQQDGAQAAKRQCAQPSEPGRDRDALKDTASPGKARLTGECRAEQHEGAHHRKSRAR